MSDKPGITDEPDEPVKPGPKMPTIVDSRFVKRDKYLEAKADQTAEAPS